MVVAFFSIPEHTIINASIKTKKLNEIRCDDEHG